MSFEMRVANAHQLDYGESVRKCDMTFRACVIGFGDFTFRLTLGIIPDPDLILGVLYHETTIPSWWKINSSHVSG